MKKASTACNHRKGRSKKGKSVRTCKSTVIAALTSQQKKFTETEQGDEKGHKKEELNPEESSRE